MPQIETKYFGPVDYQPDSAFEFPEGLPGFEAERRWVFLERPDASPLLFMQNVSRHDLCFLVLPVLVADPDYRLSLAQEELDALRLPAGADPEIGKDLLCAAVVCAGDETRPSPTVNLLAPIVVDLPARVGMQAILAGSGYSHRRPLFPVEELVPCL